MEKTRLLWAALLATPLMAACSDGSGKAVCTNVDFGTSTDALKVGAFIRAANAVIVTAKTIDTELLTTCTAMASDLGIPAAELKPTTVPAVDKGEATQAACTRVATEIKNVLQQNLPSGSVLSIVYTPPACTINVEAQRQCIETCERITITETELQCKPGSVYGSCGGTCSGSCDGTCGATCTGQCTGKCNGTCSGTCSGVCTGTCSAKNAAGQCVGTCTGTCNGVCSATCTGSCDAQCYGSCNASCSGDCHGSCSVAFTAPKCEEVQYTRTVTDCETSCDTQARAEASCTAPNVEVAFLQDLTADKLAKVNKVITTLRNHYGAILKISNGSAKLVANAAGGFYTALQGLSAAAQNVGATAYSCIADAITEVAAATARIDVSVTVTVSITANASVGGSATAM